MKKIEYVYREILYQALEKKQYVDTQLALSKKLKLSLSTVHHAVQPLITMGAIESRLKNFHVLDAEKILYYWASVRNVQKDIIYATRVEKPMQKIEAEMPADIIFGVYSAYKFRFHDVPSDYAEIYVYGAVEEIKKRFPPVRGTPNLFILEKDEYLEQYGKITSLAQTFVDLWNTKEWYAKEFLEALKKKLIGMR